MPAARTDVDWSAIAVQASAGATHQEIAEHWDLPLGTVKARCTREGWKSTAREIISRKNGAEHEKVMHPGASRGVTLLPKLGDKSKLLAAKLGQGTLKAIQRKATGEYGDDKLIALAPTLNTTVNTLAKVHDWGNTSVDNRTLVNINLGNVRLPEA